MPRLALVAILCFAGVPAGAQDGTSADASPPAVTSSAAPQPASTPVACAPSCRSGYTCIEGVCVSACNPPCAAGDTCDASGECVNPERERERHSIRRHDDFYLRLELGAGYYSGSRVSPIFDIDGEVEGTVTGVAQVGALMVGGTIASGLVLGGGAWGANVPSAEYDGQVFLHSGPERSTIVNRTAGVDLASTSVIGPFLAWYPDPTKGLNAEIAVGLALATIGGDIDDASFWIRGYDGYGWGLQVGVGYDFWIGEQWSLGVLARTSYVNVGVNGETNTLTAWVPALAGAVTFH